MTANVRCGGMKLMQFRVYRGSVAVTANGRIFVGLNPSRKDVFVMGCDLLLAGAKVLGVLLRREDGFDPNGDIDEVIDD